MGYLRGDFSRGGGIPGNVFRAFSFFDCMQVARKTRRLRVVTIKSRSHLRLDRTSRDALSTHTYRGIRAGGKCPTLHVPHPSSNSTGTLVPTTHLPGFMSASAMVALSVEHSPRTYPPGHFPRPNRPTTWGPEPNPNPNRPTTRVLTPTDP